MKKYIPICLILSVVLLFSGCSSKSMYSSDSASPHSTSAAAEAPSNYKADSESFTGSIPILTPSEMGDKKLSYTVTLHIQTTDFMSGMRKLLNTVGSKGGYIEFAEVEGYDLRNPIAMRKADFRFRIPSEKLAEFLVVVEDNYNLWYLLQETDDDTVEYKKISAYLDDLREHEKWLYAELEKTEDSQERINLERQLADVQLSIVKFTSTQAYVEDSVALSTVYVRLFEVVIPEEVEPELEITKTFGEKLNGLASESFKVLILICQGLVMLIVALAPFLIPIAFIVLIIIFIRKASKKRKQKHELSREEDIREE